MSKLRGVKGFSSFDFFSSQYVHLLALPTSCMQISLLPQVGQNAPMGCSMCFWKKNPYKWFFILIPSFHPTGEYPLKCYLQLQYSSMLLAVFPFMCQILTEWFHLFLYLDLLVILLQASLIEMWIFNFKLDITSLRDTQGHQTQHV